MSAKSKIVRNPVRHLSNEFPANLSPAGVERIRAMVLEYRPIPEIAIIMRTTVERMEFYLRDRRARWLGERGEGHIEFLPHKTVIYRRRSSPDGGFVVMPFSLPANSMHRAMLEQQA